MNNIYEIYDYNIEKFNFLTLVEACLAETTNNKIKKLNDITQKYSMNEIHAVEKIFYDLFHTEKFSNLYNDFICNYVVPHFDENLVYQVIPAVRIAFPKSKSVNFHNDCWYGHGEDIKNIWVPLTNVRETQSLAFLGAVDNETSLSYFYKSEPSLIEIQSHCEKLMKFAECDYGQFLLFPTKALHGTVTNNSDKIRVSFDFRISTNGDYGLKNQSFFKKITDRENNNKDVKYKAKKNKKLPAIGYLNQLPLLNEFSINQTIQQESIKSFCSKKNFDLIILETELIGFKKPLNLEDILFGNRNGLANDIVIFSDKLLFLNNKNYFDIIKRAILNNMRFHFANEGYILDSVEKLDALRLNFSNMR